MSAPPPTPNEDVAICNVFFPVLSPTQTYPSLKDAVNDELTFNEPVILIGPLIELLYVISLLAELYCSLGFLETGNCRIVSRSDLIAGYVGQTALKTMKILKASLGGVLFIDEAYSLGGNSDESGSSYSKECIDTINKFLSETPSGSIMARISGSFLAPASDITSRQSL
jgi:hypothetical protein